ncbi:HAMP domain-containing histidine kinase [Paenibacillus sp. N1-5-1-14]|uniref:sensor histidine kinase n=1 Tax=Paenibacillus radicibacter TaxID=2972488 RepID=UPI002158B2DF|nr:HAMP domain-containing sensor histidine kinase [Paenibacillus radicibacter]MCR8645958.1 HAMP domain-containing histidine kinase [Paenibacillus radicibacter]
MANMVRSFRSQMITLFSISMLISGLITYGLYKILQYYYRTQVKFEDLIAYVRLFISAVGDINFFLILFIPLAILFFFLFTKRYAVYFNEISTGIRHLANGDFDKKVTVASHDEFGGIAADINLAGQQLKQAVDRGDFAESSKDQLVLNLAHDLRTPLTSVIGYLVFIMKDEQRSKDQVRHYMGIAYAKSQRLEKLIDELFEITRMNYGNLPIDKQPIDLSELLTQLSEELYPVFEKNHLEVRLNVASQLVISGDGDLLARVFENLLTNAIRYGGDGQFVDIHVSAEGDEAVIQVINYGDRIHPDDLPHLFDMFYTGDKSRVNKEGSTGLGLFISKNIVTQHNGTITVESSLIRTKFEIRLPAN